MNTGFVLLVIAIVAAASYGIGRGKGIAALIVVALVAAVGLGMGSTSWAMAIGYGLAFGWPFIFGAAALGAFAGALARKRQFVLALLPFLPFVWMAFQQEDKKQNDATERQRATEFASQHPALSRLVGGPVKVDLSSSTVSNDHTRDRYEFSFSARNSLYAIVNVDTSGGGRDFKLACVTSLPMGQRDVKKGACDEDVVALDDPNWSLASAAHASGSVEPTLTSIPQNSQVFIFGVHHAHNPWLPDDKQDGVVRVKVVAGDAPVVLVLANYGPVKWAVENAGRPIAAVLVTGLTPATVIGVDVAPVPIGKYFPYQIGAPEEQHLRDRLKALVGNAPQALFQGTYRGWEFTVRMLQR